VSEARLVAVLGYSDGSTNGRLHPICAARLVRAAEEVKPGDAVLLSGWARRRRPASEAELMARAWAPPVRRLVLDRTARSTLGNAIGVARAARALGVGEVVVVTSGWHGRRASALARAALRDAAPRVRLAVTSERGTPRARLRELACWLLVPVQSALAARTR